MLSFTYSNELLLGATNMRVCFVVGLVCGATVNSAAIELGAVIPPYPEGTEVRHGVCISDASGYSHNCDYAVEVLESVDGTPLSILVLRSLKKNAQEAPKWQVTDVVDYPDVLSDHFFVMTTCRIGGKYNDKILAVVKSGNAKWWQATSWAGVVDISTGKFNKLSPADIECENEGWGL